MISGWKYEDGVITIFPMEGVTQRFLPEAQVAALEAVADAARACLLKRPIVNFSREWDVLRNAVRELDKEE